MAKKKSSRIIFGVRLNRKRENGNYVMEGGSHIYIFPCGQEGTRRAWQHHNTTCETCKTVPRYAPKTKVVEGLY